MIAMLLLRLSQKYLRWRSLYEMLGGFTISKMELVRMGIIGENLECPQMPPLSTYGQLRSNCGVCISCLFLVTILLQVNYEYRILLYDYKYIIMRHITLRLRPYIYLCLGGWTVPPLRKGDRLLLGVEPTLIWRGTRCFVGSGRRLNLSYFNLWNIFLFNFSIL